MHVVAILGFNGEDLIREKARRKETIEIDAASRSEDMSIGGRTFTPLSRDSALALAWVTSFRLSPTYGPLSVFVRQRKML